MSARGLLAPALAIATLLAGEARAACPSTEGCPIAPQTGTQPCNAELSGMMERAARNGLGDLGPDYGTVGQGCANPVSVSPTIPCVLTKSISYVESNWRQFCASACGEAGLTVISFDCGYGLTQVTSGMGGGAGFEPQRVAQDPVYNLGAGMRILCSKWRATPCVGDNQPGVLEHWYFATWAYNSFSWRNNPNNPEYPASRPPYNGPGTLSRGNYPYQEIVWGFIGHPPQSLWEAIPVGYPNRAEICATSDCRPSAAISEPASTHTDPCQSDFPDDALLESEQPADPVLAAAGAAVDKRWTLRNTGERIWSKAAGYGFVRVSADALGAPARVELADAAAVAPGATVDLRVQLTAPASGSATVAFELRRDATPLGPRLDAVVNVPTASDADGDGYPATGDCDDADPAVHPGADELCDGRDQDCDGHRDEELSRPCEGACGTGVESCVDAAWAGCTAPAAGAESCNGLDDDCDGEVDEGELCPEGEGCFDSGCAADPVVYPVEITGGCGCAAGAAPALPLALLGLAALARRRAKRRPAGG